MIKKSHEEAMNDVTRELSQIDEPEYHEPALLDNQESLINTKVDKKLSHEQAQEKHDKIFFGYLNGRMPTTKLYTDFLKIMDRNGMPVAYEQNLTHYFQTQEFNEALENN